MNPNDLTLLVSRTHTVQPSVLSVYLSVDQSMAANLNRSFESRLKSMAAGIRRRIVDIGERERFAAAAKHMTDFVSAYTPAAVTLALFFDVSDGFFWHGELQFAVDDDVRWGHEPFLQPLIREADELEAYGVVLTDRARMRLFLVTLGQIEEVAHRNFGKKGVRHLKTAGTDRLESSSRRQRKADNKIKANLQEALAGMDHLVQSNKVHRFVLAGTPEVTRELRELLPSRLAQTVVGETDIAMQAAIADVLSAAASLVRKYEQETEIDKVNNVVTAAAKQGNAVVGLGRTLKAINSNRVWELIYSTDLRHPGFECPKCAALFSARPSGCTYCGARLEPVANVVERAVQHALRKQARIEAVTDKASLTLNTAGGIGAFLKARTGTLEA